jgi:Na+-transporting NADH:ubiquinone oxidoreductase subunit NqrB
MSRPLDFLTGQGFLGYATIFAACILTQVVAVSLTTKNYSSIKSALITALGLCLLCKANSVWVLGLAGTLAIASKFLIRYKGKHMFNPANLGIIMAILLTGEAWVSPGQWGSNIILLFVLSVLGAIVLLRVGRIETSLAFLFTFGGLVFARDILWQGWPLDHFLHTMTNGSLLLFTFFMITDPVTTPNARKARILWAVLLGVLTFFMLNFLRVHDAPIYVLFFVSPITVLLDRYFKGKRFSWSAVSSR